MTAFDLEVRRCKVVLLLRAAIDAKGNICAAARATGLHRNTAWRLLKGAGYNSRKLKRLTAQRIVEGWRKPVAGVGAAEIRRVA
jgi:molybdenum-dependent DNA-binding transcriptional regulator ModE